MSDAQLSATISEEQAGQRFDQALAALFPDYSRERLKGWIKQGRALLDDTIAQPRTRVKAGQAVTVDATLEAVVVPAPEPMRLDIVYADDDIMVINKPAGLVVHPGAGNASGTLMNGLLHYAPELDQVPRAGIVHRIDKDTSGLLLIARSVPAHTRLVRDLEQRLIRREYRAVCCDRLVAGAMIDAPIGRDPGHRTRMKVLDSGKPAVTNFRVLARFAAHSFIAVRLETGRTHQIRVHMAHVSHPLVGDPVYGGRLRIPAGASEDLANALKGFKRQALHAFELKFIHPVSQEPMHFQAPLPADLRMLLHALAPDFDKDFGTLAWPE